MQIKSKSEEVEEIKLDQLTSDSLSLPFGQNKPKSSATTFMKRMVRNSLQNDIAENQKERANTSQTNKSMSQMVQKREAISEVAGLVKDALYSRKSMTG